MRTSIKYPVFIYYYYFSLFSPGLATQKDHFTLARGQRYPDTAGLRQIAPARPCALISSQNSP